MLLTSKGVPPSIVLLDVEMPLGPSGFDVLDRLHQEGINTKVILITAHDTGVVGMRGARLGISDFIPKAEFFDVAEIKIKQALEYGNKILGSNTTPYDILNNNLRLLESEIELWNNNLEAQQILRQIKTEIGKEDIDTSGINSRLDSLKQIAIGASGGVAATGVIEVIAGIVSIL